MPAREEVMMKRKSLARMLAIGATATLTALAAPGPASADAPGPGDACAVWHATTEDVAGQTMWCNHTMTGAHDLVWQYGGPSDE